MRNYIQETLKNKIAALLLIFAGVISVIIERDGTFLLLALLMGLPLFFASKNVILD